MPQRQRLEPPQLHRQGARLAMPLFLITYTSARHDHQIEHDDEWITDSSYDRDRARESFEHRFPGTAVVRCEEAD